MDTMNAVLGDATMQELRQSVRGEVVTPADAGYDAARAVWNGMIDRRPALVVRCCGVADVIAAVRFARSHDLLVAVRGGKHNVAGFGTCDGGIVIDLGPMKGIRVDPEARTVTAQAGALWGDLDHETQAFGLATPGGLVSSTGVAGLTLGGGIGALMRAHGLTIDNLLGADVVTADGRFLRASAEENADLFWGLRGGGGNFGIVTSFDFRLHPVGPIVYGGALFYPADQAAELLGFYAEWTRTLPDDLTTFPALVNAPPAPFIPQALHFAPMLAIVLCYAGSVEDGEATCAALRAFRAPAVDLAGPMPYVALQQMFDAGVPHGVHSYWRTEYLDTLSARAIETLVTRAAERGSPLSQVHIHHLEGAVARIPADATAFGRRDARFVVNIVGLGFDAAMLGTDVEWVRRMSTDLRPYSGGGEYVNFMADEGQERVRRAYGAATYDRLATLKRHYDPTNLFRLNQNILPAT